MTVFENLFVAAANGGGFRRDEAYDRCIDALKLCGMVRLANRRAEALGLLDRKRLELARAIATDPVVLLLDEIGGGLPTLKHQNSWKRSRPSAGETSQSYGLNISFTSCSKSLRDLCV